MHVLINFVVNLRNTEIFCEIAARRSFSKAALARQISQPAVSQALQQLEEQIGVELVDRSKRPIELTPEGTVYFERCQKWLDEYREIEDAVHQYTGKVVGRVRITSIYSVGLLQMFGYVRQFREDFPDVELEFAYARTDDIYRRILRDETDLGIVSFPREGGEMGCIPWQDQEMVLAVAPSHESADREQITLEELTGMDFVAFSSDLMISRETEKLFKRHRVGVNVVHRFDNVENVKRAAEIGLGAAVIPRATMLRELEFGTLQALKFADVSFVRPLGIIHKRHKHLSNAAERFIERLHEDSGGDGWNLNPSAVSTGSLP